MAPMITHANWKLWRLEEGAKWSDWTPFTRATINDLVPTTAGTYALGWAAPKGEGLGRLLGTDPHAILDIGRSGTLRARLASLKNCADTEGAEGHMAGWRLGTLGLLSRLNCKSSDNLLVSWVGLSDTATAHAHESYLLRAYFELFGELPPLNYQTNWTSYTRE